RSPLPAVLVEAGVIVHRDEELALALPQFRARFAAAIAGAVAAHCRR
ncbi:MAG: N-acetylmuramoyl-L-alanine amidase, partial [Alphaproteobacteria bacterium]|nr:N-acetylmuramoyl-L-alanine amidase [Alphaproteobacteria bacterium]